MKPASLDEKVAEKMGWTIKSYRPASMGGLRGASIGTPNWRDPDGVNYGVEPPPFSSDWNATKILIKFMRDQQAFIYLIGYRHKDYWHRLDRNQFFKWYCMNGWCSKGSAEIIDDNLPLAACEAFIEVEL